ncbi:hypothetical protein OsI_33746 [Oryza sativa Indica Group]|uniref:starch synthase n=1 Tax=Oryza sativa subsp. indica TaxID=39946 RepID=B8BH25_ORYSI|nr:hypothetical protein OsI_33746 [Oryza sativa Indica Group]
MPQLLGSRARRRAAPTFPAPAPDYRRGSPYLGSAEEEQVGVGACGGSEFGRSHQLPSSTAMAIIHGNQVGDDSDDGIKVTNEKLRAVIRKSKEVLEIHRNLLEKVHKLKIQDYYELPKISASERKKITSIIEDSSIYNEQDPFGQRDSSFYHLDEVPDDDEFSYDLQMYLDRHPDQSEVVATQDYEAQLSQISEMGQSVAEGTSDDPSASASVDLINIILVAAECAPWSKTGKIIIATYLLIFSVSMKGHCGFNLVPNIHSIHYTITGGLGDVAGALPKALARRGHRVMVVVPMYKNYAEPQQLGEPRRYQVAGQDMEVIYYHAYIDGVDFVFIDNPIFHHVENDIYGGDRTDILKRMVLLCKAAIEVPWYVPCGGYCYGDGNLVFLANDWHTALLPVYLKAYYHDNGFMIYARSVLVIHNIAHQGRGPLDDFSYLDLPVDYMDLFKLYDPFGGDHLNIFAAGIKAADRLLTVSHGYAWELKTAEGGWGLHGIINESDWKFQGIVNGIDTTDWNPRCDIHLKSDGYTNYSLETVQAGKQQCKAALQKELGLPVRGDVPVIAFIGRLDHQKGVDLIAEAMPWIAGQDVQLIMLGTGRQDLEDTLRRLESQHYDRVRGWVGFSIRLAHRMTAGADILLMPSRFEPCGLNQLYAMMYGTVPVVHAVGGLRDTVEHYNPYEESGIGWTFEKAEANRLIDALGHCLNTYRNYRTSWEGLQKRGMMQDLSWDNAAKLYEEVLLAAKYQW